MQLWIRQNVSEHQKARGDNLCALIWSVSVAQQMQTSCRLHSALGPVQDHQRDAKQRGRLCVRQKNKALKHHFDSTNDTFCCIVSLPFTVSQPEVKQQQ